MLVLLIILAALGVIALLPVTVKLYYKYDNKKAVMDFSVICGFIKVFHTPSKEPKKQKKKTEDNTQNTPKKNQSVKDISSFIWETRRDIKELIDVVLRYTTRHIVKFRKFKLHALLGLDDAAETSIAYGTSSAVLFNTLGSLDKAVEIKGIDIDYKPDFTNENIFIEFESIIRTNHFHVIALIVILLKGGLPILKKRKGTRDNGKSN